MGRNLTNLYISQSFQFLTQISGSELQTGLGDTITGSLLITASKADTATTAVSASYSNVATSASYALVSTSSSFAINATNASTASIATSASYALTASFALNAGTTVSTASLLTTASAVANVITFTKGDGSTFPVTVATGSAVTVNTGSLLVTASVSNATITYTKGDGTTFNNVVNNVVNANSASVATSASYAVSASQAQNAVTASFALNVTPINTGSFVTTASISNATTTFTKGDGSTFALTANNVVNADSASVAISASQAVSASFASNIANGLSPTFANVTASNVLITGTASVALLYTETISSSVIYSSGSNQFGDASNDVQTLYGTFNVVNGPSNFTGSVNSVNGYTGSLLGTASFATSASQAVSSSFATSASLAISSSFASTASFVNTLNQAVVVSGSINVSGSVASSNLLANWTDTYTSSPVIQQVVTLTQAEYNAISASANVNTFYVISDSVALNPTTFATTGSNTFVGNQIVTGSVTATAGFTGSLFGTASFALNAQSINTGSFATTGSNTFVGNQVISGSFNVSGSILGNVLGNNTDTFISSAAVQQVVTLTQAEYNAIGSPNANTLYIISGSAPFNSAVFATTGSNTFTGNQTINASASADYWLVDTKPFAQVSTSTIIAGRIDGADEDFVLAGRNFNGTIPSITMTDGEFIYNEAAHIFTGSVSSQNGFTGSLQGTASFANNATSASLAQTASFFSLAAVTQNAVFSGSVRGEVRALTISSQTASLDCSTDNFFTLLLVSGSTTFVNPSNILPGQTINLRIKQASVASGSISFASSVKQVSGSLYTPTATANAEDIVTFIAFDSTNLYLSNIKNFV
jgi:hypothetical protein